MAKQPPKKTAKKSVAKTDPYDMQGWFRNGTAGAKVKKSPGRDPYALDHTSAKTFSKAMDPKPVKKTAKKVPAKRKK